MSTDSDDSAIDEDELLRSIPSEELGIEDASNESLILADSLPNVGCRRRFSESGLKTPPQTLDIESPDLENPVPSGSSKRSKFSEVNYGNALRLVMIGKTGTGKSATANSILGRRDFKSKYSAFNITQQCKLGISNRFDRKILVVDTPELFDTGLTNEQVTKELVKWIELTLPGPHVFLLTLDVGRRFLCGDDNFIANFVEHFGVGVYNRLIIVFTSADLLDEEDIDYRNYVENTHSQLKARLNLCGNKFVFFNNKLTGDHQEQQVKRLIDKVDEAVHRNDGLCYTNEMYIEAEKTLRRREDEIKRKLKEEERRKVETEVEEKFTMVIKEMEKRFHEAYEARIVHLQTQAKASEQKLQQQIEDLNMEHERRLCEMQQNSPKLRDTIRFEIETNVDMVPNKINDWAVYFSSQFRI